MPWGEIRQTGQLAITHQERCPWERGVSGHGVPGADRHPPDMYADRHPPDRFRGNLGSGVTGLSPGSGGSVGVQAAEGARLRSPPVCCDDYLLLRGRWETSGRL